MFKIKILIVLITCLTITSTLAQDDVIIPLNGGSMSDSQDPRVNNKEQTVYYKDLANHYGKYLHTWVYDDGTTYLKITFTKKTRARVSSTRFYMDRLVCEFLYKENGITIYDTYSNGGITITNSAFDYYIFGSNIISDNSVQLMYQEPPVDGSCDRYASGKLTLDLTTPSTLNWTRVNNHLYGSDDKCADGTSKDLSDFVIPTTMTLVKQN